jgi:hypothetical protein
LRWGFQFSGYLIGGRMLWEQILAGSPRLRGVGELASWLGSVAQRRGRWLC